jgi:hypothetical protein
MVRLSIAEARRLGLIEQEPQPDKPRKEWGTGPVGEYPAGWSTRKACTMGRSFEDGRVHLWQARDEHRYLALCGREMAREGWAPDGRGGEPCCPWCFKNEIEREGE